LSFVLCRIKSAENKSYPFDIQWILFAINFGSVKTKKLKLLKLNAMKRIFIFLLCLAASVITFGQEKKVYLDEIRGIKVTAPKFTGALVLPKITTTTENELSPLNDYLLKNIQYPENSKKWGLEGTEVVQFVVTPEGEVKDFNIINSVSKEIDAEVVRVLKTTNQMWKPGMNNETPVAMEKEVSIAFNISTDDRPVNTTDFFIQAKKNFDIGSKKFFIKENNKSALRYFDKAMQYLPYDKAILLSRGMCRYELGDKNGACQDWNRIKTLGGVDGNIYLQNFCEFKGYADMISIIQEK
jgi:TonB family protein